MITLSVLVTLFAACFLLFGGLALVLGWYSGGFKMLLLAIGLAVIAPYLTTPVVIGTVACLLLIAVGRLGGGRR